MSSAATTKDTKAKESPLVGIGADGSLQTKTKSTTTHVWPPMILYKDGVTQLYDRIICGYRQRSDGAEPPETSFRSPGWLNMTKSSWRGAFILLEGLDRSGKTTQCAMLTKYLLEQTASPAPTATATATAAAPSTSLPGVIHMRFPARETETGKAIDAYLTGKLPSMGDQEIHALFSKNRWEQANKIRATLLAGQHIVMDRYSYSGIAYSTAKGLDQEWCMTSERGLPAPDLVLMMDVSPEEAAKRGGYGKERYETKAFQTKVRTAFDDLLGSKTEPPYVCAGNVAVPCLWTPSDLSADQVHAWYLDAVVDAIHKARFRPLATI